MTSIQFTFFPKLTESKGRRVRSSWPALIARLSAPKIVASKHDAPGISLATYIGDRRALANVERVFAVGLDLDHDVDWEQLLVLFADTESFLHTTFSSTDEDVRARVFLLLSRPVTGDEYRRVYAACAQLCADHGLAVDRAASDPSRFWFLPSIPPAGRFRFSVGAGKPVNVEWALSVAPEQPQAPVVPLVRTPTNADLVDRARAYLAKCAPAVSGSGGHKHTFFVAQRLVRGFGLDDATALALLAEWNQGCVPPWSERDLRRKIDQAARVGRHAEGGLRDRPRRAS